MKLFQERRLWKKGYKYIAGLDEAGRGPLAGPVIASAVVVLDAEFKYLRLFKGIKDSKKLTAKKRNYFYNLILDNSGIVWAIGRVSEKMIDRINIKNASELAMEKAIKGLGLSPDFLIIDGNDIKNEKLKSIEHKLIVKADEKVFSCALASIIAKVTRDMIMEKYHKRYPQYDFARHKGYSTKEHRKRLDKYGSCKIHRTSFKLVKYT